MPRVGIGIRRRVSIGDPEQPAVVSDDDVRVLVEGQEARDRLEAIADGPAHQQPARRRDVVAERQLREIAAVERDEEPPEEAAEHDAALAFIRREGVRVALRVVELLLPRVHVHVGRRQLAEVDFGPRHLQGGNGALHRHVAENQRRQSFGREAVDRVHRDAVAVRVDQLFVDPVAASFGQLFDIQFADREHHLAHRPVDLIPIDVDVGEVVIGADFLNLPQRVLQRAPVPQPDVLDRRLIVGQIDGFDAGVGGKRRLQRRAEHEVALGYAQRLVAAGQRVLCVRQRGLLGEEVKHRGLGVIAWVHRSS